MKIAQLILFSGTKSCSAVISEGIRQYSSSVKAKKIGIIGMGRVGSCIYQNLIEKGFSPVAVHDYQLDRCKGVAPNVAIKSTPREVAKVSDVVITALPSPSNVKEAFKGIDGINVGLKKGAIWIDHSTSDFEQNIKFNEAIAIKGAEFIESPIMGTLEDLKNQKVTTWVAGHEPAFLEVKPILEASCSAVIYAGGFGNALVPKIVSTMLCCAQIVAISEVLMIAKRSHLDMTNFWNMLRNSPSNSIMWESAVPCILSGKYDDITKLDVILKNLKLCVDLAKTEKIQADVFELVYNKYKQAIDKLGPDGGCYSPVALAEENFGEELRALESFKHWKAELQTVDGAMQVSHKGLKPRAF